MDRHWYTTPFVALYSLLRKQQIVDANSPNAVNTSSELRDLIKSLKGDLLNLTIVPKQKESSRKALEKCEIEISSGEELKINQEFLSNSVELSTELKIDDLIAAEILFYASQFEGVEVGTGFIDSGKLAYYNRKNYILYIVSYIFNSDVQLLNILIGDVKNESEMTKIFNTILESFSSIDEELGDIKELISKAKILDQYNNQFISNINYRRETLFKQHQILGEILSGFIKLGKFSVPNYLKLINHVTKDYDPDDLFIIHYIPALLSYISNLESFSTADMKNLYSSLIDDVLKEYDTLKENEPFTVKPIRIMVILVFLIYLIKWCKDDPARQSEFDFNSKILKPITIVIEMGSIEQIMCISAELSINLDKLNVDLFYYDFRSLLEQNIPRLIPKRILDINEQETSNYKKKLLSSHSNLNENEIDSIYVINSDYKLDEGFSNLLCPLLSNFILAFIKHGAFLLTKLRDTEEDALLSNEVIDLDDISSKADLERLYLSIHYLYNNREDLASVFWEDKNSDYYGFLEWAAKNNSPLMTSTFCLMLSSLSCGTNNANEVYKFLNVNVKLSSTRISLNSIVQSLDYYNSTLSQNIREESPTDSNTRISNLRGIQENVILELGEDSIVFIAGFFSLISSLGSNLQDSLKLSIFGKFEKILTSFINIDTPLLAAVLQVFSNFVDDNLKIRYAIWQILDNWIFNSAKKNQMYNKNSTKVRANEAFTNVLKTFPQVSSFVSLINELSKPLSKSQLFKQIDLIYPENLGEGYRKGGIWPYIEYLMLEIWSNATPAKLCFQERLQLQFPLLQLIFNSLVSIDWEFINDLAPRLVSINLDEFFMTNDYIRFMKLHPSISILNYVFDDKVYNGLFSIVSTGIDEIDNKALYSKQVQSVELSLSIILKVLKLQKTFNKSFLPALKSSLLTSNTDNIYYPNSIGTNGLKRFDQALLFNLPTVVHFALYVGSNHYPISKTSLEILSVLSNSPEFVYSKSSSLADPLLKRNRLLTTFETIDESVKIKFAFIHQLQSEIDSDENLAIKLNILTYLANCLRNNPDQPNIAHFLLGFEAYGINKLSLGKEEGNIESKNSVFKTLIILLGACLDLISDGHKIDYGPVRISCLVLEIVVCLSRSSLSSSLILAYLRNDLDFNLFSKLINCQPKINHQTVWSTEPFNRSVSDDKENLFLYESAGPGTLLCFIKQRSFILQYLSLEFLEISKLGSISKLEFYTDALINGKEFLKGAPKILSFLDVLEFNFDKVDASKMKKSSENYDLKLISEKIHYKQTSTPGESILDLSVMENIFKLICHKAVNDKAERKTIQKAIIDEGSALSDFFTSYLISTDLQKIQLSCLHSWVQVIQVIVADGPFSPSDRSNFILEIFQTILPKINDYLEFDIQFVEELISLSVLLYDIYEKDGELLSPAPSSQSTESIPLNATDNKTLTKRISLGAHRLYPLFQTCINGILCSQSTPSIRSDLYVLANKYLKQILPNEELSREITMMIKSADNKLIDLICNDSICAEGSPRITSILLLESLIHLSSLSKVNFILNSLIKNNYLLLLVRSIKRTDEILYMCSTKYINSITMKKVNGNDNDKFGITVATLLYELTAFKAILYFLIRVAETRSGASQLIQCELFQLINSCEFLLIDPDLGLDLSFDEFNSNSYINVNLSLDKPLALQSSPSPSTTNGISYFELLVPIFQLISAVLLSIGPSNKPIIQQIKKLLTHFHKLILGVVKRDALIEIKKINGENVYKEGEISYNGLKELVKLFVLLNTLTNHDNDE